MGRYEADPEEAMVATTINQNRIVGLSAEQAAVAQAILARLHADQVQTVGGYAGTGKTVLVSALADELPHFAVCAFTGKAAHILRRKGVALAGTIHGIIYWPEDPPPPAPQEPGVPPPPPPGPVFRLKDPGELRLDSGQRVHGFLVDEASMISRDLYEDLLSFGLPCVFVGDHGQLPPVGDGDVYLMDDPDYRLETIHRNAGPVARFAEHLRQGEAPGSSPALGAEVRVIHRGALTDAMLLDADQVICAFNKTRVALNHRTRALRGRQALLEVGDRVICLRNAKPHGLFNGMQGIVQRVCPQHHMHLQSDAGRVFYDVPYDPDQFGKPMYTYGRQERHPFDYAYAITCHKAQGSEWGHVLVQEQFCPRWEHQRWAYTAASRAQERLTWVL
jgi:exodeoxyribonuclease-5